MDTSKGNMRAKIADFTAKMKRWDLRIALDDTAALAARGSPFALLPELLAGPRTTLLMVLATAAHHFNALDQLSRLCAQQRVWSAVLKPSAQGVKQLVVYVPQFSPAERVAQEVERLAQSIQLAVALKVVQPDTVPHFVVDALVTSTLVHDMEAAGCTIVGEAAELQIVLCPDMFTGAVTTVAVPQIHWHYDPYRRSCSIQLTCIPVVMKLTTIAEESELAAQDVEDMLPWKSSSRVRVLPRLSEGWVIARFDQLDTQLASSRGVAPGPQTDEEFRSYWLQVHGIHLPKCFGGYARIRFSSSSVLTYPACCVATEWTLHHKHTRIEALEATRSFVALSRKLYGEQSVEISSPDDQQPKEALLLPASALLKPEYGNQARNQSTNHHTTKKRMITHDRFAAC